MINEFSFPLDAGASLFYLLVFEHFVTEDPILSANRNGLRQQYCGKTMLSVSHCGISNLKFKTNVLLSKLMHHHR